MIREEDKPAWRNFLVKGRSVFGCCYRSYLSVLGCGMSKQGIRSLIYCLLICGVIWSAVAIKILHAAGVFNG